MVSFKAFSYSKKNLCTPYHHIPVLLSPHTPASTNPLQVSMDFLILDILYKRSHIKCGPLALLLISIVFSTFIHVAHISTSLLPSNIPFCVYPAVCSFIHQCHNGCWNFFPFFDFYESCFCEHSCFVWLCFHFSRMYLKGIVWSYNNYVYPFAALPNYFPSDSTVL